MYERNKSVIFEETGHQARPRSEKVSPAGLRNPPKKPRISANLAAGMLENNQMNRPKGTIDFLVSFVAHSLVIAVAILLPLYFSDALDLPQMETTYLVAPPLPPPPAPPSLHHAIPRPKIFLAQDKFYEPRVIPKHVAIVKDLQTMPQPMPNGVAGGVPGGVPGGQLGGVLGGILGEIGHPVPPPPPPKPVVHRGPYRVGGRVQAPRVIRQVQPIYPILAREVRIQGAVVIDSIIDEHGNVTQMKLISGHPLLVTAAFGAVQQWKYAPTLLNGEPVPVEMQVTVHFNLGS